VVLTVAEIALSVVDEDVGRVNAGALLLLASNGERSGVVVDVVGG
jgi:hypothetical protein